jgi:HPt (histidine-containing phosphotransfer) domain-containing protein
MTTVPDDARPMIDVLRGVGGDEMVASMARTFVEYTDGQMLRLVAAVAAGDLPQVARLAHSVKSSARQLGAHALGEVCAATEAAAKAGQTALALDGARALQREYLEAKEWLAALATAPS